MSTSTPNRVPTDPPPSYRAIKNLIATYAELVDDGDFEGVGILLADATFRGGSGSSAVPTRSRRCSGRG